jgi:hypothetical protein
MIKMVKELAEVVASVGKKALYHTGGMKFPVVVENVKVAYGKVYYYISNGVGEGKWTTEDCLEVMSSEKTKAIFGTIKEVLKEVILP